MASYLGTQHRALDGLSLAASYAMVRELRTDEMNMATFMPATIEGASIS